MEVDNIFVQITASVKVVKRILANYTKLKYAHAQLCDVTIGSARGNTNAAGASGTGKNDGRESGAGAGTAAGCGESGGGA